MATNARSKAQETLGKASPAVTLTVGGADTRNALAVRLFSTGSVGGFWQGKVATGLTNPDGSPMVLQVNVSATIVHSKSWA